MMQLKTKYIFLVALILSFLGCEKLIHNPDPSTVEPSVYLSVNIRAAQPKSGLRSSINEDDASYEDRVHSLAMLVFNSSDGSRVGSVHINNGPGSGVATRAFTVELVAGREYDFYFVANMPGMESVFNEASIPDRSAMDSYLNTANRELNTILYHGATASEGFPMARIYKRQMISSGGTIYQPMPFKPKQLETEQSQVVVNASGNGTAEREYVELIRVVAKLEVVLDGITDLGVEKVYYRNANNHFRLVEFETTPTGYYSDNTTSAELNQRVGSNTYVYYMPEAIVQSATWNPSPGSQNKPVNYFTIVTESGTEYDIPVISNETSITSGYLAKATGQEDGFVPNYTIKRNDHYKYVIKNLDKIEILYQVVEWNRVDKALYMGYGYDVEVEGTSVSINNTIEACDPYHVRLVTTGGIRFSDGSTQKDFTDVDPAASTSYELSSEPVSGQGEYLRVYFINVDTATDTPVHVFSK